MCCVTVLGFDKLSLAVVTCLSIGIALAVAVLVYFVFVPWLRKAVTGKRLFHCKPCARLASTESGGCNPLELNAVSTECETLFFTHVVVAAARALLDYEKSSSSLNSASKLTNGNHPKCGNGTHGRLYLASNPCSAEYRSPSFVGVLLLPLVETRRPPGVASLLLPADHDGMLRRIRSWWKRRQVCTTS